MTEEQAEPSLEAKLKADVSGEARDAILAKLQEQADRVKRKMDSGVSPAEFEELDKQHTGLVAGSTVTKSIWRHYHSS